MAKANAKKVRASEAELKDKLVAINRVQKLLKVVETSVFQQ